jgi:hypothetical protein
VKRAPSPERIAIVRTILEAPPEASHQDLSDVVHLSRETVRRIRYGLIDADILPDLPRLEADVLTRRCSHCIHYVPEEDREQQRERGGGRIPPCDLGFEESRLFTFARSCGWFWPCQTKPSATPSDQSDQQDAALSGKAHHRR